MTQSEISALQQRVRELELAVQAADDQLALTQRESPHYGTGTRIANARAILTRALESI